MKKLLTFSVMVVVGFFAASVFAEVATTATANISPAPATVTAANLNYTTTLRPGAQSVDVMSLQARLKNLGYYTAALDGKYGPATVRAVAQFQVAHNLSADGVAGTRTFASLAATTSADTVPTLPPVAINDTINHDQDAVACTMIYQPVCGQTTINCVTTPCPQPDPVTYGNKCMMEAAGAHFLYEGTCKYAPITTGNSATAVDVVVSPQSALAIPSLVAVPSATLRVGSSGAAVSTLQASLKNLGYYHAGIDGKYGPATLAAVRAYQSAKALKVDGIVGVNTLAKMTLDSRASVSEN